MIRGRWLTPDRLGGDITNPQSLNRYAYALNNPTTLTDPSGLCPPCNFKLPKPVNSGLGLDSFSFLGIPVRDGTVLVDDEGSLYEVGGPLIGDGLSLGSFFGGTISITSYGTPGGVFDTPANLYPFTPPANNTTNPPACQAKVLNAANNQFGTNYTSANVTSTFNYSTGAPPGEGTLNLNISGSTAGVTPGYYPVNWYTYIIGYGPTLHVVSGPGGHGGLDSQETLPFSPTQGTFHIDSGFPYNPVGALSHWLLNMTRAGGYPGC